jgi:branched-chain amino acid transport system permease protein
MSGYLGGLIVILCLNIILAYAIFLPVATGQLNLGGAAFQAVGAYSAAYISTNLDLPVSVVLLAAAFVGGLISFFFALSILRTRRVYLVLATFAFAEFLGGVIVNVDALGGSIGMTVPVHVSGLLVVGFALAVTILVMLLMQSRFGIVMRAVHDDDTVAELMGIGVRTTRVAAFALGGIIAGLAGGLYAFYFNFVDVQAFDAVSSIYLLLFVLLGGTQTVWGPAIGAAFFTLVPELFRNAITQLPALGELFGTAGQVDASWRFVCLGIVTVVMMAVRPEGALTRRDLARLGSSVRDALGLRSQPA